MSIALLATTSFKRGFGGLIPKSKTLGANPALFRSHIGQAGKECSTEHLEVPETWIFISFVCIVLSFVIESQLKTTCFRNRVSLLAVVRGAP